jgi:Dolichyl-phosphate-mannose-protein mannosyltransferase
MSATEGHGREDWNARQAPAADFVATGRAYLAAGLAAIVGLGLLGDSLRRSSATYDEVIYIEVAARWWRTGDQDAITRMGSPLTCWKVQQVPVLWALDRAGLRAWVDDPLAHQRELLPLVRAWSLTTWLAALVVTAAWARSLYGPRAMALAAWLFALSPNLLAHGALVTMELPLVACTTATFFLFWGFLRTGSRRAFGASAAMAGLAFSCKFTAVLVPPLVAVVWWVDLRRRGGPVLRPTLRVAAGMLGYVAVLIAADVVVTGFATIPISGNSGDHPALDGRFGPALRPYVARLVETPVPRDWAGFATQVLHQRHGGPSYLLGERRQHGWWYYYFVAMAVKVPLTFWILVAGRLALRGLISRTAGADDAAPTGEAAHLDLGRPVPPYEGGKEGGPWPRTPAVATASTPPYPPFVRGGVAPTASQEWGPSVRPAARSWILPTIIVLFLAITAIGSTRNYGLRYLLPLAPLAIVWVSGLAEAGRRGRRLAAIGLLGQALAVASIHPQELTYFNVLAGGPVGGRRILSDSNLDWGQGLKALARLQRKHPEYRDLTLYYFGLADPRRYGVVGEAHLVDASDDHPGLPPALECRTRYLAVSASLQWGPWGPAGYFRPLDGIEPVRMTDDATIAIYRWPTDRR